jgi:hypothetical protein
MPQGTGANGIVGIAMETVSGTYTAPTKYVPIYTESIKSSQDNQYRRPIRQSADIIGTVPGNQHFEGDIELEALTDCVPYFLNAARLTLVKTGTTPKVYTGTPTAIGVPTKTMSITVVRNGVVFGYAGCTVGQYTFSLGDDGKLMFKPSIVALSEASQASPSPAWPTSIPFGAGMYDLEIPTAAQVFDADTLEFTVNDNAKAEYRIKNTGRGPSFVSFGEREVQIKTERDFVNRTEYDNFKTVTSQAITFKAIQDANNEIDIVYNAGVVDSYEVNLTGQGDLLRAGLTYMGNANAGGTSYSIVVKTTEDFVP